MATTKPPKKISEADAKLAISILEATGDYRVLRRMPSWPEGLAVPADGMAKVVILDTETTGLDPMEDKTIEIGMIVRYVDIATGEFVGGAMSRSWLEDPGFPLAPNTIELTGITDADLKGQTFNEAEIAECLKGAALVIAHSAWHDRPFFEERFPSLNNFPWGCSLNQVNWKESGIGSSKLDYLLYQVGMFHGAHRALPDCQALGHILTDIKLPSGLTVLQHLIDCSIKSDFKIEAAGADYAAKDALKGRGYYWDGDRRVWHRTVQESHLDSEMAWLHQDVYMGRSARLPVTIISARARYSNNPPEGSIQEERRSIGTQGDAPVATTGRAGRFSGGRYKTT
jgi:DNA polymerase-3 subunit epsilon